MALEGIQNNFSTLVNVHSICEHFQLSDLQAKELINEMIVLLEQQWNSVCEDAKMTFKERDRLWEKAVFNPFIFQGWKEN